MNLEKFSKVFSLPGTDDIFVTMSMLNGPYYWDRKDLPGEWEDTFSFWIGDDSVEEKTKETRPVHRWQMN